MAYSVHPSDPRTSRGKSNSGNNEASQPPPPRHSALSSTDPRALMDPRQQPHRGGATLCAGAVSSGTLFPLRGRGSNHHLPPPVMSSNLPPPALPYPTGPLLGVTNSSTDQNVGVNLQSSVRPPQSLLPMSTHTYPGPAHPQPLPHVPPQRPSSASSFPPILPPPPQWFNPSRPTFPPMTHLPPPPPSPLPSSISAYVHPVAPVSSSSPLAFPRPPPSPLPPPQNFPSHPSRMGPPFGHGPYFVTPHQSTKPFQPPFDLNQQGLPGFKPAPAPVGIEEKMGLAEVKGQRSVSDSGLIRHMTTETTVSDPFIMNWLKSVKGSYLRHQQHQFELKQHSMKVCA